MKIKLITLFSFLFIAVTIFFVKFDVTATERSKDLFLPNATFNENNLTDDNISISLRPEYNKLTVDIVNKNNFPLDNIVINGTATSHGDLKEEISSLQPYEKKSFTWNINMTKTHMDYEIYVKIYSNDEIHYRFEHAKLDYTDSILADAGWGAGTFPNIRGSINYHFKKHGKEVNAKNIHDYLIAAYECREDTQENTDNYKITVSSGANPAHKYKNLIDKRYIILLDSNNDILSFGR